MSCVHNHLVMPHNHLFLQTPHHTALTTALSPLLADEPPPRASDSALPRWCEFPRAAFAWNSFCLAPLPYSATMLRLVRQQV